MNQGGELESISYETGDMIFFSQSPADDLNLLVDNTEQNPEKIEIKSGTTYWTSIEVKTWTNVKSTINSNGYFIFDQSYTVQSRGQYKLIYSVKCYKSGAVIDTASSETAYQVY